MSLTHLELVRSFELDILLHEIRRQTFLGKNVLEIGSGTGWQAKKLLENGYCVSVIDVPDSIYAKERILPILDYDGRHIPFSDSSFDVVFSSSVLEHIPEIDEFQNEIKRVLKPNGVAIHIVPSGTWRLWTIAAHYPFIVKTLSKIAYKKVVMTIGGCGGSLPESPLRAELSRLSKREIVRKAIIPPRHGEVGTVFTEIYHFSKQRWLHLFQRSGWKIESTRPNKLFYTGHMILGSSLPISFRESLSYFLGSSCHIFTLKKT
jgi:Methylase involved in ubiquinone/menaquinone biosynthesis